MIEEISEIAPGYVMIRGDCREARAVIRRCDAILTDPPYGINHRHSGLGSGTIGHRDQRGRRNTRPIAGDDAPFDPSFLLSCDRLREDRIRFFGERAAEEAPIVPEVKKPADEELPL